MWLLPRLRRCRLSTISPTATDFRTVTEKNRSNSVPGYMVSHGRIRTTIALRWVSRRTARSCASRARATMLCTTLPIKGAKLSIVSIVSSNLSPSASVSHLMRTSAHQVNPCQGHLLELKLAGIQSLGYEEFWQLFGEGCCPSFEVLLDTKLSPYLSAHAYAFWKNNKDAFSHRFYAKGYSGYVSNRPTRTSR